jgi:hypothetical protein
MRLKIIACEALTREVRLVSANSPHIIDIEHLAFGLHNTPDELRRTIQSKIDDCEGRRYDYIVLGYGLCSRGTAEVAARSTPIIVPRAHDCITLFLGSRARYDKEFAVNPGTYYYSPGWIERKEGDVRQGFIDDVQARSYEEKYQEYIEKYGEDNARYLIEQEQQWHQHYTRAAFINMGIGDIERYREFTREISESRGWKYAEIDGDLSLIEKLADGDWNEDEFLLVEPGKKVIESFDEKILKTD